MSFLPLGHGVIHNPRLAFGLRPSVREAEASRQEDRHLKLGHEIQAPMSWIMIEHLAHMI